MLIIINRFFNQLLFISIIIFLTIAITACNPRPQYQPSELDTPPSAAQYEYQALQSFKAKHKQFYNQFHR